MDKYTFGALLSIYSSGMASVGGLTHHNERTCHSAAVWLISVFLDNNETPKRNKSYQDLPTKAALVSGINSVLVLKKTNSITGLVL